MQFTKFASLSVLFFVALFGVVVANPIAERALTVSADVGVIIATLQKAIVNPIAGIKKISVNSTSKPTFATASPFVKSIILDINVAAKAVASIKATKGSKRQTNADDAAALANIITEVTETVSLLGATKADSIVSSLLPGLDSALDTLLSDVDKLLVGVLTLVATLLVDVAGLLESLALGLTLASLPGL